MNQNAGEKKDSLEMILIDFGKWWNDESPNSEIFREDIKKYLAWRRVKLSKLKRKKLK